MAKEIRFPLEEFAKLKDILVLYHCALKTVTAKLEILNEDFRNYHEHNPIEHIKHRIKSPESIAKKLAAKGHPLTAKAAWENVTDIAGSRVICSFSKDIYYIADILKAQDDIKVVREIDYIQSPKASGYRSYHLIVNVPVYLSTKVEHVNVEIQLRTSAMDFWASLEHKVRYKYEGNIPASVHNELISCADKIDELDHQMYLIHDLLTIINQDKE